jgi:hypothetical protein
MVRSRVSQDRTPNGVPPWATSRRAGITGNGETPLEFGADRDRSGMRPGAISLRLASPPAMNGSALRTGVMVEVSGGQWHGELLSSPRAEETGGPRRRPDVFGARRTANTMALLRRTIRRVGGAGVCCVHRSRIVRRRAPAWFRSPARRTHLAYDGLAAPAFSPGT